MLTAHTVLVIRANVAGDRQRRARVVLGVSAGGVVHCFGVRHIVGGGGAPVGGWCRLGPITERRPVLRRR